MKDDLNETYIFKEKSSTMISKTMIFTKLIEMERIQRMLHILLPITPG